MDISFVNVTITASDGVRTRGWFMHPDDSSTKLYRREQRPTVIFMHENAGNIGLRLPYYKHLIDNLEVNILSMAYRGYSYSDQVPPNEEGLKRDAEALLQYLNDDRDTNSLKTRINYQLVFLVGRSLGGAVAAHMLKIQESLFRGAIIENTFVSVEAMARKMFPYLGPAVPCLLRIGWNTNRIVGNLRLPVLYVTGDQDEIVPHEQTLDLHRLTTNSVFTELYVVRGGTHNDSWYIAGPEYLKKL